MELLEILLIFITTLIGGIGYLLKESAAKTQKAIDRLESRDDLFMSRMEANADEHKQILISIAKLDSRLPAIEDCEEDLAKLLSSDSEQWVAIKKNKEEIKDIKKKVA